MPEAEQKQHFWTRLLRDTWTYHLTPRGWIVGASVPADRAETWQLLVEQDSLFGAKRRTWQCAWASPALSRAARDALRAKYPAESLMRSRYRYLVRTGEPLGDPGAPAPPSVAVPDPPPTPSSTLPALAVVLLIALAILGFVLAAPQNSYWGAYLAGKCSAHPAPPECTPKRPMLVP